MPEGLSDRGVFALLGGTLDSPEERRRVIPAAALLLLAWLAVVAYVGPQPGGRLPSAIAQWVPPDMAFVGALMALGLSAIIALSRGVMPLALLAATLIAYVTGTALSIQGARLVSAAGLERWHGFLLERLVYGATVLGPLGLVFVAGRRWMGSLRLGFGSWRSSTRLVGDLDPLITWRRALIVVVLLAGVPFFAWMQFTSQFATFRSGDIAWFVGPAALMAVVNASVEEAVFRGFIQVAVIRCAGIGRGLWLQGLFFGLHHLGMSISVLATLPGALLIGLGSVIIGKSVLETRGLGWAIVAHAVLDFGIFAAYGLSL